MDTVLSYNNTLWLTKNVLQPNGQLEALDSQVSWYSPAPLLLRCTVGDFGHTGTQHGGNRCLSDRFGEHGKVFKQKHACSSCVGIPLKGFSMSQLILINVWQS